MRPLPLANETRRIGAPNNWNPETMGECEALSVHDREGVGGRAEMVSAWGLEPGDAERLAKGSPLFLSIGGTVHPVVSLQVAEAEGESLAHKLALEIAAMVAAGVEARLDVAMRAAPTSRILVSPIRFNAGHVTVEFVQCSPLERIPPEMADWRKFGPFTGSGIEA